MTNEKKINAIADAEQAGLYYSSNTEEGFTRQIKGEEQMFVDSKGKAVKGKRDLKRIDEMRIPPASIEQNGTASHYGASIRGSPIIDKSAKLKDCIIGPKTIIGPHEKLEKCVIRKSVILENVEGYGGIIEECIIGPNVSFENDLKRTLISPEGTITF